MAAKTKLHPRMTVAKFDHGYWYATELRTFAKTIGIPSSSKLRKDELEFAIRHYLSKGKVKIPTDRKLDRKGTKDVDRGLGLDLRVVLYTNDRETKEFLEREAQRLNPEHRRKSGARYWLNRWREDRLTQGTKLTYRDLVKEYVRLNQVDGPYQQIPHGRYINFVSDYFAAEKDATRQQISRDWKKLKALDIPKNYLAWVKWRRG